jgi:hypothetical protein
MLLHRHRALSAWVYMYTVEEGTPVSAAISIYML